MNTWKRVLTTELLKDRTAFYFLLHGGSVASRSTAASPDPVHQLLDLQDDDLTDRCSGCIIHTGYGGAQTVKSPQKYQMTIIMAGMITAGLIVAYSQLPDVTFSGAFPWPEKWGKLNLVNFSIQPVGSV